MNDLLVVIFVMYFVTSGRFYSVRVESGRAGVCE